MATQNTKFIDVTRTFVPLDPNSFPTSMHGTGQEDSPEQRIPVMAYEGMNIIPTAHGYMSYFGVGRVLDIDAIPGKVDEAFIMQNQFYANIAVALTDIGIFLKIGSEDGAWTNPISITAPTDPDIHYQWTYTVINRKLYCYMAERSTYYRFDEDETLGFVIASVAPTFLNMAGQRGIFQAGGRLGFWDSSNAIAWSSLSDFGDFTPSIQTLANVVTFSDLKGRIVTIKPHGSGYIVYCTKSIVFVRPDEQATFQWTPVVIQQDLGIVYPRQAVASMPDTVHYAYTPGGLLRIDKAVSEVIVPEVTDVLQRSALPVYLYMMSNRYLFLEIMDPDTLNSLIQASTSTIPDITYRFEGGGYTLEEVFEQVTNGGGTLCELISYLDGPHFYENNPSADVVPDEDADPSYPYRPNWVAYLSNHNGLVEIDSWTNLPAQTIDPYGIDALQNPGVDADGIKSTANTQVEGAGQKRVTGVDAYVDGIWTVERFIATQRAIWELEEDALDEMIRLIEARGKTVVKETPSAGPPSAPTVSTIKDLIDTYSWKYVEYDMGMTYCKVWLTRALVTAIKMYRIKTNYTEYVDNSTAVSPIGYGSYYDVVLAGLPGYGGMTYFATAQAAVDDLWDTPTGGVPGVAGTPDSYAQAASADGRMVYIKTHHCNVSGTPAGPVPPYSMDFYAAYYIPPGHSSSIVSSAPGSPQVIMWPDVLGHYTFKETMIASNRGEPHNVEPPIFDTGYMLLEGWFYRNIFTGEISEEATGPCNPDHLYPENHYGPGGGVGCATGDCAGTFETLCTEPFIPIVIPGEPEFVVERPATEVIVPVGDFLLQRGDIVPPYPTMYGALMYDTHLKKWGKMNQIYRLLLDYSPINNAGTGIIPYSTFAIIGGIVGLDQKIRLFDQAPEYSYITYGKIGYYRHGFTTCEEVRVQFATASTGTLIVQPSFNGVTFEATQTTSKVFENARSVELTGAKSGAWHNVKILGTFDIKYIEFRGFAQGKR